MLVVVLPDGVGVAGCGGDDDSPGGGVDLDMLLWTISQ